MMKIVRYLLVIACILTEINNAAAQEKSVLSLKGLHESVEVLRDEWGINHIYAKNQHDLFFTQGYLAAKDRLFQFEIWRRQATGTVAELLGVPELKRDIVSRLFFALVGVPYTLFVYVGCFLPTSFMVN